MKSLFVFLMSFVLLFGTFAPPALSQPRHPRREGRAKLRKMKLNIAELERKLGIAKEAKELTRVKNKLRRLRREIKDLGVLDEVAPPPAAKPPVLKPKPIPRGPKPGQKKPKPRARFNSPQLGLSGGYIAGIPGAVAEIRYHNPFEMIATTLRIGAGYAQGEDSNGITRKHALIIIDAIYRLNPPHSKGMRNYFGFGINYDAYTSGQVSGTFGGQAFYGIEANAGPGAQMFAEVGYGLIRTGFSPNNTGLTAQVGYKF